MSTLSFQALPVEILYRIFDNLDAITICLSFRYVCKRFNIITDAYNRYELDFELVSKTDFELICRNIRPENILSLRLSESIYRPHQTILFHKLLDIRRLTCLKLVTINLFNDLNINNILQFFSHFSLTSFSINIQNPLRLAHDANPSIPLLPIIAQSTLNKLYLHTFYEINEKSWPNQCTLKYLNINRCTLKEYYIILQHSPSLQTIILTNCNTLKKDNTDISSPISELLLFKQVKSLKLEQINYLTKDEVKFLVSLTPSLIHLQLISDNNLFQNIQWEQFIVAKLPFLIQFQFYFTYYLNQFPPFTDAVSLIIPFITSFWLNKHWFVSCDLVPRLYFLRLYSIPVCASDFYYVPSFDKISYSTYDFINNDTITHDNVHVLTSDLATDIGWIVPMKDKLLNHHLFRNITRFEVRITINSSIDSLPHLSLLINFSRIVAIKLDIISDTRSRLADFYQHSAYRTLLDRYNPIDNSKCKVNIEKICSIIPRNIKHLDITVSTIDEVFTILTRLNHLYTVIFRFTLGFVNRPENIITWLQNNGTDFTCYHEYGFMTIWLGKTKVYEHPSTIKSPCKRAKILHRYNHFS